jgi:AcrR family transcriptional regulator
VPPRHLKVTQDQYFGAALEHLAEHGPEGLTIGALCKALGVTSGSFYHYFRGWGGFVDALLAHWETERTDRVALTAAAQVEPVQRLLVLRREAVGLPHRAEAAIRAWGRSEPRVRAAQERVDARRLEAITTIIASAGVRAGEASRLARMGLAMMVGVQNLGTPADTEALDGMLGELVGLVRAHAAPAVPRQGG